MIPLIILTLCIVIAKGLSDIGHVLEQILEEMKEENRSLLDKIEGE